MALRWVSLGWTGFERVELGSIRFRWVSLGFYRALPGFTSFFFWFDKVLLGFTVDLTLVNGRNCERMRKRAKLCRKVKKKEATNW